MPEDKQIAEQPNNNNSQPELIFLAQETVDYIRHAKNISHYILSAYTAAFGYVWLNDCKESPVLLWLFVICGFLTICFCVFYLPGKISKRRQRLYDIYTKGYTNKFRDIYGEKALEKLTDEDKGDVFSRLFSLLYPVALCVFLSIKFCHI
ncbi:MAG: hypothetical protein WC464_08045 [Bdellovibrionales bacterium]